VIPVIEHSTVRARASANAANLRAIEGQIAMDMLQNPDDYETYETNQGIIENIAGSWVGKLYDWVFGEGSAEDFSDRYKSLYDDGTGQILVPGGGTIPNVVTSKGLEAPHRNGGIGIIIDDDVRMSVHITDKGAMAFYGDYNKDDFADVAEDGYYDGEVRGPGADPNRPGGIIGGIQAGIERFACIAAGSHKPTLSCICNTCRTTAHYDGAPDNYTSEGLRHTCRGTGCGHVFDTSHKFSGTEHKCAYDGCEEKSPCIDQNPDANWGYGEFADHHCYMCNELIPGLCKDEDKNWSGYRDHKCDTCDTPITGSVCDANGGYNDSTHKCSVCGQSSPHSYENGKCACGRASHVSPNDCVDSNKDHICDTCGYDSVGTHKTNVNKNNGTHGCDYCTYAVSCTDSNNDHRCDTCRYASVGGSCGATLKYEDDGHHCNYCGAWKSSHDWQGNNASDQASAKHSCTVTGCTYQNIPCTFSNKNDKSCNVCDGGCVTPDTLITLADGSQKRIDELTGNEELLVWDHNTGKFSTAPVAYIIDHNAAFTEVEVITLTFSDANSVKMIGEHVFFDGDLGKYVAVTSENADSFIGHSFAAMTDANENLHMAELVAVERTLEETAIYELATYRTLTCFTNNVLSGCAYMDGLLNIFDIDVETMAYDAEARAADLEKYGTIEYAFFAPFVSREIFDLYNGEFMSVAMGKGVLSLGEILDLIDLHYLHVGE